MAIVCRSLDVLDQAEEFVESSVGVHQRTPLFISRAADSLIDCRPVRVTTCPRRR